jgi:oligosaccharide:H+ symporter
MRTFAINRTGFKLLMINAFIYISMAMYAPYLSSYYTKAGISAVEIGILLTIAPLSSFLIQPVWAIISDRTGRRKDVLSLVVLGSAISILSYYIGKTFLSFLIASILFAIFMTSIVPLSDAIILRSAHKNQLDFAKIRMGGTIGYAIFVIFSGSIIKLNSDLAYIMGSVGFLCLFFFVRRLPKDEPEEITHTKSLQQTSQDMKTKKSLLHIFESKQVYFLLAFAFISQVGLSFHFSFQGVYMLNKGMSEGIMGITSSIAAISELPVLFLMNRIMKKISTQKIIFVACMLLGLRIILFTGESLLFVVLSQMLHGITFMSIYYCCAVFISKNVKPENQSRGQSILALIQTGLASIIGNILGGFLVDTFSLRTAYITITVLVVTVAGLIALLQSIYQRKQKAELNHV